MCPNFYSVYVPEEFDFRTYDNMKELFEVLGISEPDLVFKFVKNYSVVPSKEKKSERKKEYILTSPTQGTPIQTC